MNPENHDHRCIQALIVDDEYPARAELRYQLSQHDDVEVTGEAATAREALRLIEALQYDVVFVDIAMPGLSGIDLAQRLRSSKNSPFIIFVTAYDEYALKAFETRALDYILKPINAERVAETLNRVRERLFSTSAASAATSADPSPTQPRENQQPSPKKTNWVMGIRDETSIPIPLPDISYLTSEGDQVYVYARDERYLTRHTLRDLEQLLPSERFFRCHRGFIVNLSHVREISPFFNGTYTLTVRCGDTDVNIPVSRSRVTELKKLFWPHT